MLNEDQPECKLSSYGKPRQNERASGEAAMGGAAFRKRLSRGFSRFPQMVSLLAG